MKAVPKLQLGGGFDSLFTIYKPILTETLRRASGSSRRSSEPKEKEDSDKGKLTEKDLFLMLKDLDGLPNEMLSLVSNLTNTLRIALVTGEDDLNSLATTYLTNLYKLKLAKYNKEQYDNAYKRAVEKNSLNEIAITINGNVLALDKDLKIISFTPEQWAEKRGSGDYQPLTNGNLLWFRAHAPGYVNNNQMLLIVENGIGIDLVHKMIKDRFHAIGNSESSSETFVPKEAVKGAQIIELMLLNGPDGYYKLTQELSKTDETQVQATLAYIYSTLPANARTRLALETSDGTLESAQLVINAMLFGTLKSSVKYSAQYLGTDGKLSGTGSKGGKEESLEDQEMNTAMKWLAGYGNKESFVINSGTSGSLLVQSSTMPLVKMNGDYLGVNSTLQLMSEGLYSSILDLRSVSMGGRLVEPMSFGLILLTDGKISSIDFPCVEQNGVVMPDLSPETRRRKEVADAQIRQRGISLNNPESIALNYSIINQIYEANGLPSAYNADGTLNTSRWRRFGVINGRASNKALRMGQFESNSLLQEDTDDNSVKNYIDITKDEDWDSNNFLWNGVDRLYKGTIWIPVQVNYHSAAANMKMKASEALRLEAGDQALLTQRLYTKPPQI